MKTKQITITAILIVFTVLLFHWTRLDLWLQDFFYNADSKQWIIDRDQKLPKLILYDGIKQFFVISILALITAVAVFKNNRIIKDYRQGLIIVLLSCLVVPLVVGGLKAITNTPCPNNITHFNGDYPYVGFLDSYPANFIQTEKQRCFPAAHASGGFALLSVFFLFKTRKNKIIATSLAKSTGWIIGFYKMLIGDHFLSHTIVSMLLAWLIILIISGIIQSKNYFASKP
jgi:membrane-associated PAP2 superfamily phosphatase